MMLEDKTAVIYGAGGAVGGAVARAFAPEGANLFPRTAQSVTRVQVPRLAALISRSSGSAGSSGRP
jgi:NAD(P)-dependent dehydrogenase (short-subunit alcohol dehydrogenase family)